MRRALTEEIRAAAGTDARVIRITERTLSSEDQIDRLAQELHGYLGKRDYRTYCLDFSGVERLSSDALQRLIDFNIALRSTRADGNKSDLHLVVPSYVQAVFEITKLDKLFGVHNSLDAFYRAQLGERR